MYKECNSKIIGMYQICKSKNKSKNKNMKKIIKNYIKLDFQISSIVYFYFTKKQHNATHSPCPCPHVLPPKPFLSPLFVPCHWHTI